LTNYNSRIIGNHLFISFHCERDNGRVLINVATGKQSVEKKNFTATCQPGNTWQYDEAKAWACRGKFVMYFINTGLEYLQIELILIACCVFTTEKVSICHL